MTSIPTSACRRASLLRTFATAVGVLAAASLAISGCSSDNAQGSKDTVLRVGSDLTYPPYAYLNGDTPAGFDPDIVREIGRRLDEEVEFKDTRFEQLISGINAGQFDVIASALYITAERAKAVDYIPYFSTGSAILVKRGSPALTTVTDLCGKRVAVIKGGVPSQNLAQESLKCADRGAGAIDIRPFPTDPEATQALISGQVEAQINDAAVAAKVVKDTSSAVEVTSTELIYPIPVGLAVDKDNTDLKKRIEGALSAMTDDGSYDRLLAEYHLEPPDPKQVAEALGQ